MNKYLNNSNVFLLYISGITKKTRFTVRLRFKIKQNRILHRVVVGENDVLLEIIIGIYLKTEKYNTFISVCMRANEDGTKMKKNKSIVLIKCSIEINRNLNLTVRCLIQIHTHTHTFDAHHERCSALFQMNI